MDSEFVIAHINGAVRSWLCIKVSGIRIFNLRERLIDLILYVGEVCRHYFDSFCIEGNNFPFAVCLDQRVVNINFCILVLDRTGFLLEKRSKFLLSFFLCHCLSCKCSGNDLLEEFCDGFFVDISTVNVFDMCSDSCCSVLDVKPGFLDLEGHLLVDGFEEVGISGTCNIRVIQCRHVIALQQFLHTIKVHCLNIFEIILCCGDRFLTFHEIVCCRSGDCENKNDQKDDQSGFLFFLFIFGPPCHQNHRIAFLYLSISNYIL